MAGNDGSDGSFLSRRLLDADQVAFMLKISTRQLASWVKKGIFPPPIDTGEGARMSRWPMADVDAWVYLRSRMGTKHTRKNAEKPKKDGAARKRKEQQGDAPDDV